MLQASAPTRFQQLVPIRAQSESRKRILFLAEGSTMAHFARPAALAQALDPREWDVHFWTPERYHRLLCGMPATVGTLRTLDPQVFLETLARGGVIYSAETLAQYVRDELELFARLRPDFVIGDFRLSLSISAPLAGIPFAAIWNAHWSPYRRQPCIVPELPITHWIPARLLAPLYALLRPAIHALHAKPANDVRRALGLARGSYDMRRLFCPDEGMVLHPDIPEFVPLTHAPPQHRFIGICPWSPEIAKPVWWERAMASARPKVMVSLGSSGPLGALPAILKALAQLPIDVLVATSGRTACTAGSNVYAADLLPFEETARRCALVISQGGSTGMYLALRAGTPQLAIPNNVDNHLAAALLEQSGAGLRMRSEYASPGAVRAASTRLLGDASFKAAAVRWSQVVRQYDTRTIFPQILRDWFACETRRGQASRTA